MRFAKAHAYGNDFLYVDRAEAQDVAFDRLAPLVCDRHTGIGADGLIVYATTDMGVTMRLYNADGGIAELSGNGVRGLGALLLADSPTVVASLTVQTDGGVKVLARVGREGSRQTFRAAMGQPVDIRQERVTVGGESLDVVTLSMGNPQCLILGALPSDERFARVGAALEWHERFPAGTNVEFVEVEAPDRLRIRIWERGVGPTTSSGTGSCASLVAAAAHGGAARDAQVIAPGGSQRVEWRADGVYLTGWAEVLCVGTWLGQIPRTS